MNKNTSFMKIVGPSTRTMRNFRVFYPFMLYACLQLLLVTALAYFYYPPFSAILVPIFKKYLGEQILHYPNNFVLLHPLFEWTNIVLSGIVGVLAVGSGTLIFVSYYQNKPMGFIKSIPLVGSKYLRLFAVWIVETIILLGVLIGLPSLISSLALQNPSFIQIGKWLIPILAILVGAMFAYTTVVIVVDNRGIYNAIKKSFVIFSDHPIMTYVLIGIPMILLLPLEMLKSQGRLLVTKFYPEFILNLVVISILLSVLANCWMVGAVTKMYLSITKGS